MRFFKFTNDSAIWRTLALCVCVASMPLASPAEPVHAIAMYGEPALKPGFTHLPYANPEAPKGGAIRLAETGTFDSLNPWILMGNPVWPIFTQPGLLTESLMMRSIDEPFTLYGLLAESVETDPERSWVEFTLRPEARFSDGSPVTVEDVMWSYETLGTKGHPRYTSVWAQVDKMEQTGPNKIRFSFKTRDRELALLMGMRPILKKAQWQGVDFSQSSLTPPIGSGPYVIDQVDPGRSITFRRNPDYWGRDLPVSRGLHNFDTIRYDYFGDAAAMFEAFKAGEIDVWRELVAARWDRDFDFPAIRDGRVVKSEIPHQRPSGIIGLVMNTRNPLFADWRVRQAMIEVFNYRFINLTLSGGKDPRITSYFANSELAMQPGPARGREAELLAPYADSLPPGALEGYVLPEGGDRAVDRQGIRAALELLRLAGWTVQEGELRNAQGQPFKFEILLNQSGSAMRTSAETRQIIDIFVESLRNLGIRPQVTMLDAAQYVERTNNYQFDMTWYERGLSLSPGNEQRLYWGRDGVTKPGSRNWMGMDSPAAEAMIDAMLQASSPEDYRAAVRALDRVLTTGRYVIPVSYSQISRLAHRADLHYPEKTPLYGDWPGFMPETWWRGEEQ
ncbi:MULTISPECIES: extracellular solute-binding protein [unclassified Paracoccus (in: a-proteobacteria)]|uniref:extracellular solute-binding protein n=1 Tax=unclassified Paracoccus (in: a-proteobacteria) TaxID=2688777 RepID=UPI0012B1ABCF|nr:MULTISPECIES: extracellular solute-binding protein [unclassified Paracoccus (in: a-proteobacteria)]UXU74831.1 extracellular solute-binding protein [Paracoccus sp. SMMA_5]UXU80729.1 extracellular solute-binding protein [Paracoccus sp. SMMA_5_TC]